MIRRFWLVILLLLFQPFPVEAESLDSKIYTAIHEDWKSNLMDKVMNYSSDLGDGRVGLGGCLILSSFGGEKEREVAKLAFTAMGSSGAICLAIKFIVDRPRPEGESDRWNSSFPSGHAAGAFSLVTIFSSKYPRWTIPLYATATLIGLSRIYLGHHYPSDVMGGAILGFSTAKLILHQEEKILKFHF